MLKLFIVLYTVFCLMGCTSIQRSTQSRSSVDMAARYHYQCTASDGSVYPCPQDKTSYEVVEQPHLVAKPIDACQNMGQWILDPMALSGKTCTVHLRIVQIIDEHSMLLEIEGSAEAGKWALFFGQMPAEFGDTTKIIDGQRIAVLGTITGTQSYTNAMGARVTVPLLEVRNITPQNY